MKFLYTTIILALLPVAGLSQTRTDVSAVSEGLHTIDIDGDSIEFYSRACPAYTYITDKFYETYWKDGEFKPYDWDEGEEHKFHKIVDANGQRVEMPNISTWSMDFYLSPETGYFVNCGKPARINTVTRVVNGRPQVYKEVKMGTEYDIVGLYTPDGKCILKDAYDITYSTPDHSIRYKIMQPGTIRMVEGAIFLRDSTLNVPPQFNSVGYAFDTEKGTWAPYVTKKYFGEEYAYTPGMDATPEYEDECDKWLNTGYCSMVPLEYETKMITETFNPRKLAILNYAARLAVNDEIFRNKNRLDNWPKVTDAEKHLKKLEHPILLYDLERAQKVNDYVASHSTDSATIAYARDARDIMAQHIIDTKALAQSVHNEILGNMDYYRNLERLEAAKQTKKEKEMAKVDKEYRKQLKEKQKREREAQRARNIQQSQNDQTGMLIALAIMGSVNRTLGQIFGSASSSYTTGRVAYSSGAGSTVSKSSSSGSSSSSSSSYVQKPQKCSTCKGTGQCSGCRNHIGKANSSDNSPRCNGCHGDGRCFICGGSGYKPL